MPPAVRFSREAVLNAAHQLIRRDGEEALNARSVARELGGSTQPIFRLFSGMDELREAVIKQATDAFHDDMYRQMDASDMPYVAMSLCYLTYAKREPQMFKLLFMRDRVTTGCYKKEQETYAALYARIASSMQITVEQAAEIYARSWFFVHGLAVSIATKYIPCMSTEEMIKAVKESYNAAASQLNITIAS